jgi:predicted TPR repeat methyltransferase
MSDQPQPDTAAIDYRTSHIGKGADYDKTFVDSPARAVMWELEKQTLSSMLDELFLDPPDLLDFACGTGRIAAHIEARCRTSTGVDVSASMLEIAKTQTKQTELLCIDLVGTDALKERKFDLITAFRFFPNAEEKLRADAMQRLAGLLSPRGYLIFNNHKNDSSLMLKVARLAGRGDTRNMSSSEVSDLVSAAGLRIRTMLHLGYLNFTDTWMIRPQGLALFVERQLMNVPALGRWAQNVIYVCSR